MAMSRRYSVAVMLTVLAVAVGTASGAHKPAAAPASALVASAAPAPAATVSPECMEAVYNMSNCMPYIKSGSTMKHHCCPELDGVLQSNPVCLCQLDRGSLELYGFRVDYNRAKGLPGICSLNAPPLNSCAAYGYRVPVAPSSPPSTGVSPSATGPQMPDNPPPSISPSKSAASSRFTAHGLATLAALPLAITAAAMF